MTCISCNEWFEVYTNTYGPGLCYCPCCGWEFSEDDFADMKEGGDE